MNTKQSYKEIKELVYSFINIYFDEDDAIPSFFIKLLKELKEDEFIDISRGKPEIWASSVIVVVGRLNFLFDKSVPGSLKGLHTVCNFLNTSKNTVGNKASKIQEELNIRNGNYDYSLEEIADSLNAVELPNGFVVTVKYFKEIESTIGKISPDNFEDKMDKYYKITKKNESLKVKQREIEYEKLKGKWLKETEERRKIVYEEKQKNLREKWEKEKETQPDFLDIFGME